MKNLLRTFLPLCLLLMVLQTPAVAQVNVGAISGTVVDASGNAVPGARVVLVNELTGAQLTAVTGSSGAFTITPLQAGQYRLSVEAQGFKKSERSGLVLQVGEKLGLEVKLEVGSLTEAVEVKAATPLLATTNANVGQVIDQQKILELPLPGRDTLRLAQIAAGVGGRTSTLGDFRLGGGRIRQAEFYVDGSPTSAAGDARATALPSIDAIAEFKVETNNLAAEYGRLSGGAINVQTRSGTNEYHGSLYNFARDDVFNANSWDANRRGTPRGSFTLHQFGGTIGGPLTLPKKIFGPLGYEGRNRSFFFFNYDGLREYQDGQTLFATVPTELERRGDFSQTVNNNGQRVTIHDPLTYNRTTNQRQLFANNRIPENRFDPAARYMLSLWPLPNRPGDPGTGRNNFAGVNSSESARDNFTMRFDHNFTQNHRVYLRLTRNYSTSNPSYWAGPATAGVRPSWLTETGSTVNWTWTASPTLIVSAQFGAAPRDFTYYPVFSGFDPTSVPFAANARRELDPRFVPNMNFERVAGLGVSFQTTWLRERYFIGQASATKLLGRHTIKFGYEIRPVFLNNIEPGAPSGQAAFDGAWTGLNQQAALAQQGSGFASFLLGLPNSFSFDSGQLGWAVSYRNHAAYVQDDLKVNRRLTLNLGLRWDYEAPLTERFDRLNYIDYGADNGYRINPNWNFQRDVIQAGRLPATAPDPNVRGPFVGGIGLVSSSDRGNTEPVYSNFGPRLGLAYQITGSTVLRSGFGILYAGYTGNASGSDSLSVQRFFRSRGAALITPDAGQTVVATLSNPFPNNVGLQFATNDRATVTQLYLGSAAFGYERNHKPSYEISYNFGLQQQVKNWLFEATFVGNRGVHLYVDGNPFVNPMDPKYLSLGALLETQVANPFANAGNPENGTLLTRPTIQYKYLLRPQPHLVGDVRVLRQPRGDSIYLAGYFKAERRLSRGLSLLVSYTLSKLIENTPGKTGSAYGLPQDGVTLSDIRGLSTQDAPHKLVVTYLYELPFGKGKRFLGAPQGAGAQVLSFAAGGWKLAGFTTLMSGYPLQITQTDNFTAGFGYGRLRPTLIGNYDPGVSVDDAVGFPTQSKARYINPAAFAVTNRYAFGSAPATLPNFRQPRFNQTDFAVMRDIRFTERMSLQVRLEAQNFFNHPVFELGGNEQNIQNANFGYFNQTASGPRTMQFGARFVF